jgi:hypothetical protein
MSDKSPTTAHRRPGVHVELADDVLMPRREFAEDILGVTDKTAARMGLPTTYLSNVAHVLKNESLRLVAARVRWPNQRRARGAA